VKQLSGHLAGPSTRLPGWGGFVLLLLGCFVFPVCSVNAASSDLPPSITLNLPVPANLATPSWLGHPETPATNFATLNLPILTPDTTASLLMTVYFQEKQGGFMRITWKGTQGAVVLSDNFYENIGMANQRSLLISPDTLAGDGVLTLQCGDSVLGIQRIKLEWLANTNGLVSPEVQGVLVTPATGAPQSAQSLNGQANPAQPAVWQNQVVTVPLSDPAVRIEQGVEFSVDLDAVPGSARLALKEAGLPVGQHLVVWINQQRAGTITPTVPDLLDGGFLTDVNAAASYVGWRDGSFYVPVTLLKAGVNTVQFSDEADLTSTGSVAAGDSAQTPPLAIKAVSMQLNYPPGQTGTDALATDVIQPQFSAPSIEPVPSAQSPLTPPESTPTP
jgi:hypothetical protein